MKSGEQQSESKAHNKPHGCAKRGGRPVTWIGGGGLDPKKLAGLGVPSLRELFAQVFGENTASNNAGWLRRKLAESPDSVHGQRRSLVVRARDMGAAIWNSPIITPGEPGQVPDEHAAETADAEDEDGLGRSCEEFGCTQLQAMEVTEAPCKAQLDQSSADASAAVLHGNCSHHHHHRGVKRSCTEASATLAQKASALRCHSPSGSGSGVATGTHLDGSVSPRAHHKSHHHHHDHNHHANSGTSKQNSSAAGGGASGVGMVIKPESFTDSYCGLKVMVYWPADKKWWEATICGLNTALQHLQLLYSDLTEESIIGHDFAELLRKGHLALAGGQVPPASTGMTVGGLAAAALHSTMQGAATGLAPSVPALQFPLPSMTYGRRAQSCMLPSSVCADSRSSYQDFNRTASMNLCARVSATGGGNGSGSASGGELELGQLAKRQCYEESNNSGSNGSNPADTLTASTFGVASSSLVAAAEQQQRQGSDATKLEMWFASQQRQQQQLQMQMEANLQMQQQVQMQMQQQMAVHMSMQQAAGQYMHMQAPALSAPFATTATTTMPSTATAGMQVPDLHSPFADEASLDRSSAGRPAATPAAMTAPTAAGCLQNTAPAGTNGVWGAWQSACVPSYAANGACSPAGMQHSEQQQTVGSGCACSLASGGSAPPAIMQQWSLPPVQLPGCCSVPGSTATSPKACDHVVPDLNAKLVSASICNAAALQPQQHAPALQQQQQGGAAGANCMLVPSRECDFVNIRKANQMVSCRTDSSMQNFAGNSGEDRAAAAAGDVIASLLSQAGEDLFGLDQLEEDNGAMQQSLAGTLDGDLDGCDDGVCCDGCSSGGNSSLCESVADELAVAGLDADDAPGYYMFGGAGSPRQQLVQQAGAFGQKDAAGYVQQCSEVEAELRLEACCGGAGSDRGGFAEDAGFKVASEPCENSFAHMFDFD